MTLDDLLGVYRELLYLPDPTAVLAALATVAGNQLPGDPVWTLLVGPPSSGKTEIIDSLRHVSGAVSMSTITKASLLSGRTGGAGGLLLTHFNDHTKTGLLLVKDLTTILSEASGARTEVLAILREVFDGHVSRAVGTRDTPLEWAGKIGFLGGVTEEIEQHRAVIGLMGDRFIYLPIPTVDNRAEIAQQAMRNHGHTRALRDQLSATVAEFFARLPLPMTMQPIEQADIDWLCTAADLASRARSPVLRDARTREINLVPEPELPARLVGEFSQLWQGAALIGADRDAARAIIRAALLGGIPKQRRAAFLAVLSIHGPARTLQVAVRMRSVQPTAYTALEELAALGLLDSDSPSGQGWANQTWTLTPRTRLLWDMLIRSDQKRGDCSPDNGLRL